MSKIITLTTDFSTADAYVGAMKGAILCVAPDVTIVDLAHEITPHDVSEAAFVLESVYRYFPKGTVHVVVVDPGVGTVRRRLAAHCGDYYFVGPDNGVFTYPMMNEGICECVEIKVPDRPAGLCGVTFEGRDVFGPTAARIVNGTPLSEIGPAVDNPVKLKIAQPIITETAVDGRIIYIDHFGNCISNIRCKDLQHLAGSNIKAIVGGYDVGRLRNSYADVEPGEPVALVNSVGHVEIAINQGSAEKDLNLKVGSKVRVQLS